jgi:hypothetical protein
MASNSSSKAPTQQSIKAYVDTQFATKDELGELSGNTDDITEGSTNLFFTNARADARVNAVLPNTGSLSEGTNLYHTVARANTAIDARVTKTFVNALNIDAETTNKALVTAAGDVNQNLLLVFTGPDTGTNANAPLYKHSPVYYNPDIDTLNVTNVSGTSSSAKYADLAENYVADAEYEEGTVLVFGGEQEVTTSNTKSNPSIAGVVSMNPAYLMNSELQGDHIVAVALKGRVPVKVVGPVSKGDVLVHSETPGHAEAASDSMNVNGPSCIGIAITDVNAGVVEAMIK